MAPSDIVTPVVLVMQDEYFLPYALEASRGFFSRYVIYDAGSTDSTPEVIKWFMKRCPNTDFYVRFLPKLPPSLQGIFRNSMIAEALTEFYFILDGDEVYTPESYQAIVDTAEKMFESEKLYGLVRRIEVDATLKQAYGLSDRVPHHRLYRRTAIWEGPHPGEAPYFPQNRHTEFWIEGAECYHFHNALRSHDESIVPKRAERKARPTYRPGSLEGIDLLNRLPIMGEKFEGLATSPILAGLR